MRPASVPLATIQHVLIVTSISSLLSYSAAAYLYWETGRLDTKSLPSLVSYHSCWCNNECCMRNTYDAYQRCIAWKEASYYLHEEGIIREYPATSCALTPNQYWKHTKSHHKKRHVWSTLAEQNSPGFSAGHFQSIDNWLEATRRDGSTSLLIVTSSLKATTCAQSRTLPMKGNCQTCLLTKLHRHYGNLSATIGLTVWAAS